MKTPLLLIFLMISLTMNAQQTKRPDPVDVTDRLSYEDFQSIKQFVLDGGQTITYCNMYNNNPYYEFNEKMSIYLNPKIQFLRDKDVKNSEAYNEIRISTGISIPNYPFSTTYIREDAEKKKIYLKPYYVSEDDMKLQEKGFTQFVKAVKAIIKKEKQQLSK